MQAWNWRTSLRSRLSRAARLWARACGVEAAARLAAVRAAGDEAPGLPAVPDVPDADDPDEPLEPEPPPPELDELLDEPDDGVLTDGVLALGTDGVLTLGTDGVLTLGTDGVLTCGTCGTGTDAFGVCGSWTWF